MDAVDLGSALKNGLYPSLFLLGVYFDACILVGEKRVLEHRSESILVLFQGVETGRVIDFEF